MRRIRYQVACSLDGFIAGPRGEYDWIPEEPEFDFDEHFRQFDTLLLGRKTFQAVPDLARAFPEEQIYVFSTTLSAEEHPGVTVIEDGAEALVADLKSRPGKDIWLYGGGELFRSLLEAGLVDTIEPAVMPILLGDGKRLLPETAGRWKLRLTSERRYQKSGMVLLEYAVEGRLP